MARSFAGNGNSGSIQYNHYSEVDCLDTMTISYWWKRNGSTTDSSFPQIITNLTDNNFTGHNFVVKMQEDGKVACTACRFSTNFGNWQFSPATTTAGVWTHVAITMDYTQGTSMTPLCFQDGIQKTSSRDSVPSGTLVTSTADFITLGNNPNRNRSANGQLAEVAIWNRILRRDEILSVYYSGALYHPTGLVFYAPLVSEGNTEANLYGKGGSGTVINALPRPHPPVFPKLGTGRGK